MAEAFLPILRLYCGGGDERIPKKCTGVEGLAESEFNVAGRNPLILVDSFNS